MNDLVKQDAPTPVARAKISAGGQIAAMIPGDIESCFRLAQAIASSGMAPKAYGTDPNKVMVGILAGLEIGIAPFQALQSIAVINGNPTVWGDGALALVQASGLLVDMDETFDEQTNTATVRLERVGRSTPIVRSFSYDDAKKAGLLNKQGPWTQYPRRMAQMRARAFGLRDGFADVLKGMRIAEEVQDYAPEIPVAASRSTLSMEQLQQQAGTAPAIEHTPPREAEHDDRPMSEILDDSIPALDDVQDMLVDEVEQALADADEFDDAPEPEPTGPAWIEKHDEILKAANAATTIIDLNAVDAEYKIHCVAMPETDANALGDVIAKRRAELTGDKK